MVVLSSGRRRTLSAVLVPAVVAAGLTAAWTMHVISAAASPHAASTSRPVSARPDLVSARLAAETQRSRVEVTSLDTVTSRTWVNPNGTLTTEIAAQPMQAQDATGAWHALDGSLQRQADGTLAARVGVTGVVFGKARSSTVARFGSRTRDAAMLWTHPLPAPSLQGATATYSDVYPGVNLVATTRATGFELSLIVSNRAAAQALPKTIDLPLAGNGLTWTLTPRGVLLGEDSRGHVLVSSAGASAWDSSTTSGVGGSPHRMPLTLSLSGPAAARVLHIATPMTMLDAPGTVFPVTIDPSATWSTTAWTMVDSANSFTSYYNSTGPADVGTKDGFDVDRSLFQFGTSALSGATVSAATFAVNESWSASCTAREVDIYGTTSGISASTSWFNQPTLGTKWAAVTTAKGYSASCPAGSVSADVTGWASAVASSGATSSVLELRSPNESDTSYYKEFSTSPTVTVTYSSPPTAPTQLSAQPAGEQDGSWQWTDSATPALTALVNDADGGQLACSFEVWNSAKTTKLTSGTAASAAAGSLATWTVPSGVLANGAKYYFRARCSDGTTQGPWSAWWGFAVDTTAPAAPALTASWTPGVWSTSTNGSVSWTDTSSDVVAYAWQLDGGAWSNPQTATSQALNVAEGQHTFTVRAIDHAGNFAAASISFGAGADFGVSSPKNQDRASTAWPPPNPQLPQTQHGVTLSADIPWWDPSVQYYVDYQWRQGTTGGWNPIPASDVTFPGLTAHPDVWPWTRGERYAWDMASTVHNAGGVDGLVQVRACASTSPGGANPLCQETPVNTELSSSGFGFSFATRDLGPGKLSLVTGDYSVSATDANVATYQDSLSIGRALTTLSPPNAAQSVFGPGWTISLTGPDAGAADMIPSVGPDQSFIVLTGSDGDQSLYLSTGLGGSEGTSYKGLGDANDGSVLTYNDTASPATITLEETDGTSTVWSQLGSSWVPTSVTETGANSSTAIIYGTSGNTANLPVQMIAPAPEGVTCDASTAATTPGCRSFSLTYSQITVGSGTVTRLTGINLVAYNPNKAGGAGMDSVQIAAYDYDSAGRLQDEWDPRISPALKTSYGYDDNNRLTTLTPPGQAAWSYHYDDAGRVSTISRPDPANGTATTTIVYGVPFTGTGAPVELGAATTGKWGQLNDLPTEGVAIFPADHVPAGTTASTVAGSDWPYADLTYIDPNGRAVDTADYVNGAWQIGATGYDQQGNTLWSLTPGNLAQALNPTADTDPAAAALPNSADRASLLETSNIYSADGTELLDTYGPIHPVQLADGSRVDARSHTHTDYDEDAPGGGPYRLPTTTITSAQTTDGIDHDPVTAHTGYDAISLSDGSSSASGWTLRKATTTTKQLGADPSASDPVTTTLYNNAGQTVETRLPADAAGGHAGSTVTTYYTPTGSGSCISAAFAGFACSVGPASQPATGDPLPVTTYQYNMYGDVTAKTETAGSIVRTTTTTYDAAERVISSSIGVTPPSSLGTALPAVDSAYDPNTGLATTKSTTTGGTTTTLTTGYDSLGRTTSYTDAGGVTSTTSYDVDGRVSSSNDGKGTTSDSYDPHSGKLISESIGAGTAPSTFSATYDPDGNLATETYPNGLVATYAYDNAGTATKLTYSMSGTVWLQFSKTPNAQGNTATESSPQSAQAFSYDGAGRLTTVADTVQDPATGNLDCTTRIYTFDENSNRTSLSSYPDDGSKPNTGNCATATTPTVTHSSFDQADRITNTGYAYDAFGRTSTVPAADAIGAGSHAGLTGDLTVTYYANDFVASETQGATSTTFGLDPLQNREASTTTGSTTQTLHYNDDTDSPSWNTNGAGGWTRDIAGVDGNLAATQTDTGVVELQLADLHGDIIATCADSTTATGTESYSESTEFGAPRNPAAAYDTYGWLGAKQRSSDDLGGLTIMGVRVYNPATGRFLQVDPVPGGNTDPYTYPLNPIDGYDLNGQCWLVCSVWHHIKHAWHEVRRHVINWHFAEGVEFGFEATAWVTFGIGLIVITGGVGVAPGLAIAGGAGFGLGYASYQSFKEAFRSDHHRRQSRSHVHVRFE